MTSKKQAKRGYLIPNPVTGYDLICVRMKIPDHPTYIANFFGAITELQKWFNWEENRENTNRFEAADYWRKLIAENLEVGDCCDIQYQMIDCDTLEFSLDGEDWTEIANFSDCFVALHPSSTARNNVTPLNNATVALTLNALADHSVNIAEIWHAAIGRIYSVSPFGFISGHGGVLAGRNGVNEAGIYSDFFAGLAYWHMKSVGGQAGLKIWRTAGTEVLQWIVEGAYFDATRMHWYADGQKTAGITLRDDGKMGFGTDTPLARVHIKNQSAGERGQIIQLAAGASLNAQEIRKNDGTVVTGSDSEGRTFIATQLDPPSGDPGNLATLVMTTETDEIWYYVGDYSGSPEWKRLLNTDDGEPIQEVVYEDAPAGESGSASIADGTLGIIFPAPSIPEFSAWAISARNRPLPGESDNVILTLLADGTVMLPWTLANGDIVTVSEFQGWLNDGGETPITQGYRGDGTNYFDGLPSTVVTGYIEPDLPPMALLLYYNTDFPGTLVKTTPELIAGAEFLDVHPDNPYAIFMPNRLVFVVDYERFGAIHFLVTLQAADTGFIVCGESDFSIGSLGWYVKPRLEEPLIVSGGINPEYSEGGVFNVDAFYNTEEYVEFSASAPGTWGRLCIVGYFEVPFVPNGYSFDYEILEEGRVVITIMGAKIGGTWGLGQPQYLDSSLGTHTWNHSGAAPVDPVEAIIFVQVTNGTIDTVPTAWKIKTVTIGCEE